MGVVLAVVVVVVLVVAVAAAAITYHGLWRIWRDFRKQLRRPFDRAA